ncbi:MAG: hypothetical protein IT457_11865 [Planctomycetes bacterium]|nr:hypothetical protein [Planctomycetota bacterium]
MKTYSLALFLIMASVVAVWASHPRTFAPASIEGMVSALGQGGGQDPVPPWGHNCDLQKACNACFFSAGFCFSCLETKKYLWCGTPFAAACANDSAVANCGQSKKHQSAQTSAECDTCLGTGEIGGGQCSKNACQKELVD